MKLAMWKAVKAIVKQVTFTNDTSEKKSNAIWTRKDIGKLLDELQERKSASGDGICFKMPIYNEVAEKLNPPTKGASKTGMSCKNKFNALRATWTGVSAIMTTSRMMWDDELGANIGPKSEDVWQDFIKINPAAKPFKNTGWPWVGKMTVLLGQWRVKGTHVFHPTTGQYGIGNEDSNTQSQDFIEPSESSDSGWKGSDDEEVDEPVEEVQFTQTQVTVCTPHPQCKCPAMSPPTLADTSSSMKKAHMTQQEALLGFGKMMAQGMSEISEAFKINPLTEDAAH
ncbi:hypothetical protein D9756_004494 [Leucocoprinus leucothites]|uniref:Myb/SANT-like domain-containing protein n=1 Tax=Leucocoprinus leucothites TaxID=201217 RepID=A0A8H5LKF1_9AGAR|nr:hypothetical protein D9756_004494 [Leucoagaricus leucothites]